MECPHLPLLRVHRGLLRKGVVGQVRRGEFLVGEVGDLAELLELVDLCGEGVEGVELIGGLGGDGRGGVTGIHRNIYGMGYYSWGT